MAETPDPRDDLMRLLGLLDMTIDTFLKERALIEEHGGSREDLLATLQGHWRVAEGMRGAYERTLAKYEG